MKNNKLPSMEEVYAALGKKAEDYEQIAPEEIMPEVQDTNSISKMESILRGAVDSPTAGFSDEIVGAMKSPLGAAQALFGMETDSAAEYEFARRKWEEENEAAKEENPWSYAAGGLVGAIIPGIGLTKGIAAGAKALAPGSKIAQKLIAGAKLAETAPGAGNALSNAALLGMTEGAIGAGVANIGEADRLSDVTVLGTAESAAKGALLGAAIPGVVGAVKGVGSLIPGNWTKTASDTFDVTRKGINITDAKDMAAVEQELKKSGADLISSILEQGKQISSKYKPVLEEMGDIDEASRATLISKIDPERYNLFSRKEALQDGLAQLKAVRAVAIEGSQEELLKKIDPVRFQKLQRKTALENAIAKLKLKKATVEDTTYAKKVATQIKKLNAEKGSIDNSLKKDPLSIAKDNLYNKIINSSDDADLIAEIDPARFEKYTRSNKIQDEIANLRHKLEKTAIGLDENEKGFLTKYIKLKSTELGVLKRELAKDELGKTKDELFQILANSKNKKDLVERIGQERASLLASKQALLDEISNLNIVKANVVDTNYRKTIGKEIEKLSAELGMLNRELGKEPISNAISKATAELGLIKNQLDKDSLGAVKDSLFEKIRTAKNYDDLYNKKINIDNEISALERAGGRTSVGELDTLKKFREEALGLMEEKSAGKISELNKEFSEFKSLTKQSLGQGLTPEDLANESIVEQLIASNKLSADTVPLQSKVIDKFLVDLENSFKNPGQRGYKQFQTQIQQLDALAEKYPAFRPKIDKILEDTKTIGVFRDYKQPNGVWAGVKSVAMVAPKIAGEAANAFDNSILVKGATQNAKAVINKITPDLRARFANNPTILSIFDRISNPETPISVKNAYVNTLINNPMTRPFFVEEEK